HRDLHSFPTRRSSDLFILVLLFYGVLFRHHVEQWGNPTGGGMGSVAVNPVARIPLPARQSPENPVANQTESQVPTPPPKLKTQPKPRLREPEPDAILLKGRNAQK